MTFWLQTENEPVSADGVARHIARYRSTSFDDKLWTRLPPMYKKFLFVMLSGGVKCSSHGTYMRNFLEFWRTMRRLKIEDELVFTFPIADAILQAYIVDCAMVRSRTNVYGTVRGKMRAIDYIVQLAGKHQSWSTNPALDAIMDYVKRRNPNLGSDTLPISGKMMIQIVEFIMVNKVFAGLHLSPSEQLKARRWITCTKVWRSKERLHWYLFAVAILTLGCLGLRGAECFENSDPLYAGYGLWTSDITVVSMHPMTQRLAEHNGHVDGDANIHHIRFRLRNSKTAAVGKDVFLRMGRTHRDIDPAILINHVLLIQSKVLRRNKPDTFIFSLPGCDMTLKQIKKEWVAIIIDEMQFIDGERFRFHGTRKGFATTLLTNGMAMSLIAYAGQWKLHAAIYKYLIHTQADLLVVVSVYLYGKRKKVATYDFDESEHRIVRNLQKSKQVLSPQMFNNTSTLHHSNLSV